MLVKLCKYNLNTDSFNFEVRAPEWWDDVLFQNFDRGHKHGYGMKQAENYHPSCTRHSQLFVIGNWRNGCLHGNSCLIFERFAHSLQSDYVSFILGNFQGGRLVSGHIYHYNKRIKNLSQLRDYSALSVADDCAIWHGYFRACNIVKKIVYRKDDPRQNAITHITPKILQGFDEHRRQSYSVKCIKTYSTTQFEGNIEYLNGKKYYGVFDYCALRHAEVNSKTYFRCLLSNTAFELQSGKIQWDNTFFKLECRMCQQNDEGKTESNFEEGGREVRGVLHRKNGSGNSTKEYKDCKLRSLQAGVTYVGTFSIDLLPSGKGLIIIDKSHKYQEFDKCFQQRSEYSEERKVYVNRHEFSNKLLKAILRHRKYIKNTIFSDNANKNQNHNGSIVHNNGILYYGTFLQSRIRMDEYINSYVSTNNMEQSLNYLNNIAIHMDNLPKPTKSVVNNKDLNTSDNNHSCHKDNQPQFTLKHCFAYSSLASALNKLATIPVKKPNTLAPDQRQQKQEKERKVCKEIERLMQYLQRTHTQVTFSFARNDWESFQIPIHELLSSNNDLWIDKVMKLAIGNVSIYSGINMFDTSDTQSWRTLHYCCYYGYSKLFEKCVSDIRNKLEELEHGPKSRYGGHKQYIKTLLFNCTILSTDLYGYMPIHICSQYGRHEMILKILSLSDSNENMYTHKTSEGWTCAALSIIHNHVECFKIFEELWIRKIFKAANTEVVNKHIPGFNGFTIIELCFESLVFIFEVNFHVVFGVIDCCNVFNIDTAWEIITYLFKKNRLLIDLSDHIMGDGMTIKDKFRKLNKDIQYKNDPLFIAAFETYNTAHLSRDV